jgi:hypothetical protein
MAITFNKTNISTGNTIEPSHITQSYDAFTAQTAYDITLSGSLTLTGSIKSYNGFTGSFTGSLNGDFIGYNSISPVSIKVGFTTAVILNPSTPTAIVPPFPVNNIINVTLTPQTSAVGLDWYPVLTSISSPSFTITANNPLATYSSSLVTVIATIFYN